MSRRSRRVRIALACAALAAACLGPAAADMRPLADFLGAQGTTSILDPPVPDYLGFFSDPARPPIRFVFVDYAGIEARWIQENGGPVLGTDVSGTVMERPLADGRAEVTVRLHTVRAQTWIIPFDLAAFESGDLTQFGTSPLLFGLRGPDLAANPTLTPALSVCDLEVMFKNTAVGAPLPDLLGAFVFGNAAPGQELVSLVIASTGSGPLRAAFGVAEGTPGKSVVVQTVLLMASSKGALADGAPAELVDLHALGR